MQRHPYVCEPRELYLAECSECEILEQAIEDLDEKLEICCNEVKATLANHDSRIKQNTADIATNKANIATNAANIATNKANIATNASNIQKNTNDIATNKANIATNTSNIATNKANIATNASNIQKNSADIATNKANIATNTTNITTNRNAIATHTTQITNITQQVADIPKYSAGTGLSLSGSTFNHSNSVTAQTTEALRKVKYDAQGHITGSSAVTKADITALGIPGSDTNTTYTAGTNVSISSGNVISATDTKYSAGNGLALSGTSFSLKRQTISGSNANVQVPGGGLSDAVNVVLWTAPSSGILFVTGQATFDPGHYMGDKYSGITKNGELIIATLEENEVSEQTISQINNSSIAVIVAAGDRIGIRISQNSGGTQRCRAYVNGIFIAD